MMTERMSKNVRKVVTATLVAGMIASSGATLSYADNGFDNANYRGVGYISVVGEVGEHGNGGFISTGEGDAGGKSYGLSQFTSKAGGASANSFVSWLKNHYPELGKNFNGAGKAGTSSFDSAWKKSYSQDADTFEEAQMEYTYDRYMKPALKDLKNAVGIDFSRSRSLTELLYSTVVQFGPSGTTTVFSRAGVNSGMSDLEIIQRCTDEKQKSVGTYKFLGCSKKVQNSVYNRFAREEKELIDINKGLVNLDGETTKESQSLNEILNANNTLDEILDGVENSLADSNQGSRLNDILDGENTETPNQGSTLDSILDGETEGSEGNSDTSNQGSTLDDILDGVVDNENTSNEDNTETPNQGSTLDDILDGVVDNEKDDNSNEPQIPGDSSDKGDKEEDTQEPTVDDKEEDTQEPTVDDKEEVNTSSDGQAQDNNSEETDSLEDILNKTEDKANNTDEKIENNTDSNDDTKSNSSDEKVIENEKVSEPLSENEQVLASLEQKIENNTFARLFKTTKMIMDSNMA